MRFFVRSIWAVGVMTVSLTAAADTVPRTPEGKPDFSGIWQALSGPEFDIEPHGYRIDAPPGQGIVVGGKIPYLSEALDERQRRFERRATDDPRLQCFSLGTPRAVYYPEPFQIFQDQDALTLLFQFSHRARTIHTNGSVHPPAGIGFWFGDSRAHWEGDALVVSVTDFNGETWLDRAGNFHSDQLHVTEKWEFIDANTIQYSATLSDPAVYQQPWTLEVLLHRHREPGFQLIENTCYTLGYDDYYPVPAGHGTDKGGVK